jgi:hypothetical protein
VPHEGGSTRPKGYQATQEPLKATQICVYIARHEIRLLLFHLLSFLDHETHSAINLGQQCILLGITTLPLKAGIPSHLAYGQDPDGTLLLLVSFHVAFGSISNSKPIRHISHRIYPRNNCPATINPLQSDGDLFWHSLFNLRGMALLPRKSYPCPVHWQATIWCAY